MLTGYFESSALRFIPLLPLLVALLHALLIGLLRRPLTRKWVAYSSIGATASSILFMLIALAEFLTGGGQPLVDRIGSWIGLGVGSTSFNVDVAFRFDALSAVICLAITGLGLLVQVYSVGYLEHDEREDRGFERFFCFVGLLIGFMLVLVLADNVALLFVGWAGVGIATYLLVLFWYGDAEHVSGGARMLVVNLIGDTAFVLGALLLYWALAEGGAPTLAFHAIEAGLPIIERGALAWPDLLGGGSVSLASAIGICFFVAAAAKSAQLPLSAWLPEATHAPIPALALVQSITTVAAGAYLLARFSFLYVIAPEASAVVAWTGGVTAFVGAAAACGQTDVRRVLAWSTVGQLGLVYVALGVGAPTTAVYHLVGHAYAKTLLFMACGVVVLALGHTYDMREMRGIGSRVRLTRRCWWIGVLSLIGTPPFVGFFTITLVLSAVSNAPSLPGRAALQMLTIASLGLTAFYGVRFVYFSLYGQTRIPAEARHEIQDPERVLLWPLVSAVLLCVFGSLAGWPQAWGDLLQIPDSNSIHYFLEGTLKVAPGQVLDPDVELRATRIVTLVLVLGAAPAVFLYLFGSDRVAALAARLGALSRLLERGFYLDALHTRVVAGGLLGFARRFADAFVERGLIERGLVGASAKIVRGLAEGVFKYGQPGLLSAYLLIAAFGALFLVVYFLMASAS